jgi:hypothetical protein
VLLCTATETNTSSSSSRKASALQYGPAAAAARPTCLGAAAGSVGRRAVGMPDHLAGPVADSSSSEGPLGAIEVGGAGRRGGSSGAGYDMGSGDEAGATWGGRERGNDRGSGCQQLGGKGERLYNRKAGWLGGFQLTIGPGVTGRGLHAHCGLETVFSALQAEVHCNTHLTDMGPHHTAAEV